MTQPTLYLLFILSLVEKGGGGGGRLSRESDKVGFFFLPGPDTPTIYISHRGTGSRRKRTLLLSLYESIIVYNVSPNLRIIDVRGKFLSIEILVISIISDNFDD